MRESPCLWEWVKVEGLQHAGGIELYVSHMTLLHLIGKSEENMVRARVSVVSGVAVGNGHSSIMVFMGPREQNNGA